MNVLLKVRNQAAVGDVHDAIVALPQDTVTLRFLLHPFGAVTMKDIDVAATHGAVVLAYQVEVPPDVAAKAREKGVDVRVSSLLPDLKAGLQKAMEALLEDQDYRPLGKGKVEAFGGGVEAGVKVVEGELVVGCGVEVIRGEKGKIFSGILTSLWQNESPANKVRCQKDDVVEAFEVVHTVRTLAVQNNAGVRYTVRLTRRKVGERHSLEEKVRFNKDAPETLPKTGIFCLKKTQFGYNVRIDVDGTKLNLGIADNAGDGGKGVELGYIVHSPSRFPFYYSPTSDMIRAAALIDREEVKSITGEEWMRRVFKGFFG
ncbi:unnamed protein product [Closterium sp. Yama58-4]|nr:unnamed protein product [Closterium sp. Yama58-4]